jgi:hypothetical protein
MDQGRLPPREPGELEISAPVSVPHAPLPARTRVLLAAVALLAAASLLAITIPAAERGLAAQRAQATQTAAGIHQVRAIHATETTYVRRAIATQTAVAQATVNARTTFAAFATVGAAGITAYRAAVPCCPLGDPYWQTQNFDPANPNFICSADGLQILTGSRPHYGVVFCGECLLATKHETQIHIFDIQSNVAIVDFNDGVVILRQHMDGSWEISGLRGQLASGAHALPSEFTLRIRYDGSQVTVAVNGVIYATLPVAMSAATVGGVIIDFTSRDSGQPSAIRVKDFSFTALP